MVALWPSFLVRSQGHARQVSGVTGRDVLEESSEQRVSITEDQPATEQQMVPALASEENIVSIFTTQTEVWPWRPCSQAASPASLLDTRVSLGLSWLFTFSSYTW